MGLMNQEPQFRKWPMIGFKIYEYFANRLLFVLCKLLANSQQPNYNRRKCDPYSSTRVLL